MRRIIALALASLAVIAGLSVTTATANESSLPAVYNGKKFWSGELCVAIGDLDAPIAYAAQQVNLKTSELAINARNNCVTSGYPPSRRFTVDTAYSPYSSECVLFGNTSTTYSNGFNLWTNNPIAFINTSAAAECWNTTAQRQHYTSQAIVYLLGLQKLNSSGWNSRVMNNTDYSVNNVPWITSNEGLNLTGLYQGHFDQ